VSVPLTILHLTHEGRGAGSSVSIALLARAQAAAGHQVIVGAPPGCWLEGLLRGGDAAFTAISFASIAEASWTIERLAVLRQVDVVNAHSSRDRAASRRLRLAGRLKPALVMTRRGMPMSTPWSAVLSGAAADRIIAVSRPVARALARRGTPPWKIDVVHNAVDLGRVDRAVPVEEREAARARLAAAEAAAGGAAGGDGAPRLTIGVVSRRKDHDVLLRALRFLDRPVLLCVIGVMPDDSLRELAEAAAPHRIAWVPFVDDPRPFYDLFDVVTLPTRHEGLSQGLLEAMALGKPVVTTRAGGNTDLIEDGVHGLLVRPRDPRALGDGLRRLLGDAGLRARLGRAARERVRAEFTIARTLAGTEAAYRTALERR